jgi:protein-S-isoprenylcysteine O-methyltransferase Ste14
MRATELEFRLRFWLICLLFFAAGAVPHRFAVFEIVGYRLTAPFAAALTLLLFLAAAAVRTWAAAYLNPEIIHSKQVHSDELVADGPYRHLRNPLYLGSILLGAAFGMFFAPAGFLLIVAGLYIFTLRLIGREEAQLAAAQGESYRRYLAQVPRLWPALGPRTPPGGATPNWPRAFRGELMFWLFLATAAAFFATRSRLAKHGRVSLLMAGVVVSILVHLVFQPRRKAG